jgi:nitrite reductase/ring-hydroxylating ferredoxin subunit
METTSDVPVGGGALVSGVLVVQPFAGRFAAFDVRCPHRGARVSPPEDGIITCYEHDSRFRDTDGAVLTDPAMQGLVEVSIVLEGTTISW